MAHGRCHALSLLSKKYLTIDHFLGDRMGDFQVATSGGFWVAAGEYISLKINRPELFIKLPNSSIPAKLAPENIVVGKCYCRYGRFETPPTSCNDRRCGPVNY